MQHIMRLSGVSPQLRSFIDSMYVFSGTSVLLIFLVFVIFYINPESVIFCILVLTFKRVFTVKRGLSHELKISNYLGLVLQFLLQVVTKIVTNTLTNIMTPKFQYTAGSWNQSSIRSIRCNTSCLLYTSPSPRD